MSYRYYLRIQDRQGHRVEFSGPDVEELYHRLPGILESLGLDIATDRYRTTDLSDNASQGPQEAQGGPSDPPDDPEDTYGFCLTHHVYFTGLTYDNFPHHIAEHGFCFGEKLTQSQLAALKGD